MQRYLKQEALCDDSKQRLRRRIVFELISLLAISDLTMIAVGVAKYSLSELKLIATDKKRHVFTAKNFDKLLELVTSLRRKTCKGKFTCICS